MSTEAVVLEPACLLARKSQVRVEADADTVDRQFADAERYCSNHRSPTGAPVPLTVVAKLFDLESGYKDKSKNARKGLQEALRMIEAGEAKHLVVARLDRLTRQGPLAFLQILDRITKAGGYLHILDAPGVGHIDASHPVGVGFLALLAAFAQQWSHQTSINVKRAELASASSGKRHGGGKRPYGWHRASKEGEAPCPSCGETMRQEDVRGRLVSVVELCPVESELLREGARRIIEGETLRKIVTDFNKRGLKTATGVLWTGGTLSRALKSPGISGKRTHLGVEYDGVFPPILSPETHAEVLARLATNGKGRPPGQQSLLTAMNLLFCACGAPMVASTASSPTGSTRYRCNGTSPGHSGCGKIYVVQHRVDETVVKRTILGLKSWREKHGKPEGKPQLEQWQGQLQADEDQMKKLTYNCYTDRNHPLYGDDEAFKAAYTPLKKRVDELKALIAAAAPPIKIQESVYLPDTSTTIEEWWEGKTLNEKRAILSYYLKKVTIQPVNGRGPKFNPERVEVDWHTERLWREVAPNLYEGEEPEEPNP